MRKWLRGVGVTLCLLVGLLLPTSLVSGQTVTVSVDAPSTVAPGSDFIATVDISAVTDFDAGNVDVVFDSTVLAIDDITPGVGITDGEIDGTTIPVVSTNEISPGRIRVVVNVPGTPGATGSGYLFELHFQVIGLEGTSSNINLENGLLGDNTAQEIPATWVGATVNVASPAEPTIAFSPTSLSFSATEDGENPADKTLEIWNSGTGTIDWSVSEEATWLSLSPTSGSSTGEHDIVTVSVNISGMSAGEYDATITISGPGATNSPQTVPVSLSISTPPTEPTIAFSPTSLSFSATEGGANPADKTLEIWNSGTGTLDWSVGEEAAWLSLSPTSGSSTGEHDSVTVSVDISGMSAGEYDATITISDPEAANTPQTLTVSLNISAPPTEPTIGFSPESFSFCTCEGGDNPADKALEIWNLGTGTIDWSVSEEAAWLSLSPTSGSSTGEHDSVTVSVDISGMSAASYGATITISAPGAINTPQTVPVSLHIVVFDCGELTDVELMDVDPGVDSIAVSSCSLDEVDMTDMPEGVECQCAYVVASTGTGNFCLCFTDIADASSIRVYKVVDTTWTELAVTVIDATTAAVTMEAGDPPIVFALPTAPSPGPGVGGTAYLPDKLAILLPWIALGIILAAGITWLVLRRRRVYG